MRLGLVLAVWALPRLAMAETINVGPGDDFCAAVNGAAAGDEVVLAPGQYDGPCVISSSGVDGMALVVRGEDSNDPPHIVYEGTSSNVIDVEASYVTIEGLRFGPTNDAIDAIKIKSGSFITVDACTFEQIGGISVSANSSDSDGIVVRNNRFSDLQATGMYFGCHDGMQDCAATNLVIEGNLVDGVDSSAVGYGLEIKLDSHGVVRDNVFNDTKGPNVEVFGSVDDSRMTVVERNLLVGSRNNGTLEIGGGPAIARNNIVIGGAAAALMVYDFGGRDLVRNVHVLGNTAVGDQGPAISLASWTAGKQLELTDNAAWHMAGGATIPAPVDGIPTEGNVDCSDPAACWVDAASWDFWPVADGMLLAGAGAQDPAELDDDFCARPRAGAAHVGALHRSDSGSPGPLTVDFKANFDCADAGGTDGGESGESGGSGGSEGGVTGATDATATAGTQSEGGDAGSTGSSGGESSGCGCTTRSDRRLGWIGVVTLGLCFVRRRGAFGEPIARCGN